MSVSEQEAKQQIAQMRLALESMKVSARRASYVKIIGVILGFAIVGTYVYLFIMLAVNVAHSEQFVPKIKERLQRMDLQTQAENAAKAIYPVYLKEGEKMVTDMHLFESLQQEGTAFLTDLQPLIKSEMERVMPKLQNALLVEGKLAADQLEKNLQALLEKRLTEMVNKHSQQLETGTGLTEEKAALMLTNIIEAAKKATLNVVEKRWGDNEKKLIEIAALVDQIPDLPPMSEEELLDNMRDTLLALVKYKLPDFSLEDATGQPLRGVKTTAALGKAIETPAERVQRLEAVLKNPDLTAGERSAVQTELDKVKKELEAAKKP